MSSEIEKEDTAEIDDVSNHLHQLKENFEREMKRLPNLLPLMVENVIIIIAALFLPLFTIYYYIGAIVVVYPLNGRVLGASPLIISLVSLINIFIGIIYYSKKKNLAQFTDSLEKPTTRKKIANEWDLISLFFTVMTITTIIQGIFLVILYYTYLVNYQASIPNPISLIPSYIWYQYGFTGIPQNYSWFLRISYGTYVLVGTIVISVISLLIYRKKQKLGKKVINHILNSVDEILTIKEKMKQDVEIKMAYEDIFDEFDEKPKALELQEPQSAAPVTQPPPPESTSPEVISTIPEPKPPVAQKTPTVPSHVQPRSVNFPLSMNVPKRFTPPRLHPCSNCHTEIPTSAKFCYECGTPVAAT